METIEIKSSRYSLDCNATREIYLVFHDDTEYFCSKFIRSGFKHCFAIERQAMGWVCVDPSRTDLCCTILPALWETNIIPHFKFMNTGATVLALKVYQTDRANYPRPAINSCVGCMQYLLGVYWPLTFTPYMLYNRIIKNTPKHIEVV